MVLANQEHRSLLKDFLVEAVACASTDPSKISFERMRLTNGVLFNVSDAAIASQDALVSKLLKALGPVRGHRSDIDPSIWAQAATLAAAGITSPSQGELDECLNEIESNSNQQVKIVKPCQNVRLAKTVRRITVGPVSVRQTAPHLPALRKSCPKIGFSLGGTSIDNPSPFAVVIPHTIWEVEITAAKVVREEEVAWLIDVALSIIRLAANASDWGPVAPSIGKIEADAIQPYNRGDNRITLGPGKAYSVGGWSLPYTYELGVPARKSIQSKWAQERISAIFSAPKGSLAVRFGQGLGWMTRGRKSLDRPTRLLYFFTAIEALLSDADKSAPVVQTVARHAAVILSDDNSRRVAISKDIRTLYGLRSSLVHTGKRGIYDQDSNTIQYIAELLFYEVWTRVNLSMKHDEFVQCLSKASYGMKLRSVLKV